MRKNITALLGLLLLSVAAAACAHPLDYRIDTVHSQILFSADHDGYSKPVGRLAIARGWLRFDPKDWAASKVVADIDLASADLGDKSWNAAVTGRNFLDAAKFPTAHFESTSVTKTGDHTGTLAGTLSLHGVSLPVTVEFTVNRVGATLFGFETIAGFSGSATLDRTHFGITAFPKAVGTQVALRFEIEAKLDKQAEYDYQQDVQKAARDEQHAPAQH
ncbi:MAG TPA: YceI family protein [Rhodanobacteraceae bacterium]|jgi:polyisoprenoid-binding protein YceI|nr:YceI family protein [Rhodanobacteraceae bacterium]